MKTFKLAPCVVGMIMSALWVQAGPLVIDHHDVDITQLTTAQISRAKSTLHIAYGHTSHGSQLTDGMSGLVGFANGHGKGMYFTNNFFAWNNGGTGGALDLHDYAMGGDVGYWPDWYNNTVNYLNNTANSNVNVIIWSWCGQMSGKYSAGTLSNEYLLPMSSLETSYPDVVFVYMTGHVDIWDDADQKAACQVIRQYCAARNKVLYDFADIEHYNPDGTYFEYVDDNCGVYTGPGTGLHDNWATNWQGTHTQGVDWYSCSAAHSQSLNGNQKAYAAWALWCALAADLDRDELADEWEEGYGGTDSFCGGTNDCDSDGATDFEEFVAMTVPTNGNSKFTIGSMVLTNSYAITFACSTSRIYSLQAATNMVNGEWSLVNGATNRTGDLSGTMTLTDSNEIEQSSYRVSVALP